MQDENEKDSALVPSPDAKLKNIVEKRNQGFKEYCEKRENLVTIGVNIRKSIGQPVKNIDKVISTMSYIESSLEVMDELFTELGFIPEDGEDFDIEYYQWMRLQRRIADRKITKLEEVPEDFRDALSHMFERDYLYSAESPRDTDSIRDDLRDEREELGDLLEQSHDFSDFMPKGRTKESLKLDALRDELNALWDEFRHAATAIAYHF